VTAAELFALKCRAVKISRIIATAGIVGVAAVTAVLFWPRSVSIPKPKGYPRIAVPTDPTAQRLAGLDFALDHHVGAHWESKNQNGWGDLVYPFCQGRVQFTYLPVQGNLNALVDDAQDLAMKHSVAADGMSQMVYVNDSLRVYGVLFRITGNAASAMQFYATDSVRNFVRGALYVYAHPNADSLAPVHQFFEAEFTRYLETLEWREASGPI
jgi:gliding motility-associated lipoprotein GldD